MNNSDTKLLPGQDPVTGVVAAKDMTHEHCVAYKQWEYIDKYSNVFRPLPHCTEGLLMQSVDKDDPNEYWRPVGWKPVTSAPKTPSEPCNCDQSLALQREVGQLSEECARLHSRIADLLRGRP